MQVETIKMNLGYVRRHSKTAGCLPLPKELTEEQIEQFEYFAIRCNQEPILLEGKKRPKLNYYGRERKYRRLIILKRFIDHNIKVIDHYSMDIDAKEKLEELKRQQETNEREQRKSQRRHQELEKIKQDELKELIEVDKSSPPPKSRRWLIFN